MSHEQETRIRELLFNTHVLRKGPDDGYYVTEAFKGILSSYVRQNECFYEALLATMSAYCYDLSDEEWELATIAVITMLKRIPKYRRTLIAEKIKHLTPEERVRMYLMSLKF